MEQFLHRFTTYILLYRKYYNGLPTEGEAADNLQAFFVPKECHFPLVGSITPRPPVEGSYY